MSLRRELIAVLEEHGHRIRGGLARALDDFVAVVRAEGEAAGDDDDDSDDEVAEPDGDEGDGDDTVVTRAIACPHCGERLAIAIDLSGGDQDAIQDCEVCCNPIRVVTRVDGGRLAGFSTEPA